MKIAFIDFISWDYSIKTLSYSPLGGSQSALCFLAKNLASLGHEIFVLNNILSPEISEGIVFLPLSSVNNNIWQGFDFIVIMSLASYGKVIKSLVPNDVIVILWSHVKHDEIAALPLEENEVKEAFDHFFVLSNWHKEKYVKKFNINPEKISIMKNAMGEAFQKRLNENLEINCSNQRSDQIILAYTSTPFRGLDLMIDIFPRIKEKHPEVIFKSYSSMKVYQVNQEDDEKKYGYIYKKIKEIPGAQCIGSLTQDQLAEEMQEVSILTYPNTFEETSCISVMEAMASGCHVITSDLGALPETTANFATIVSMSNDIEKFKENYIDSVVNYLDYLKSESPKTVYEKRQRQIRYCQQNHTWDLRAREWEKLLYQLKINMFLREKLLCDGINWLNATNCSSQSSMECYFYLTLFNVLCDREEAALATMFTMSSDLSIGDAVWFDEKLKMVTTKMEIEGEHKLAEKINTFFLYISEY